MQSLLDRSTWIRNLLLALALMWKMTLLVPAHFVGVLALASAQAFGLSVKSCRSLLERYAPVPKAPAALPNALASSTAVLVSLRFLRSRPENYILPPPGRRAPARATPRPPLMLLAAMAQLCGILLRMLQATPTLPLQMGRPANVPVPS